MVRGSGLRDGDAFLPALVDLVGRGAATLRPDAGVGHFHGVGYREHHIGVSVRLPRMVGNRDVRALRRRFHLGELAGGIARLDFPLEEKAAAESSA